MKHLAVCLLVAAGLHAAAPDRPPLPSEWGYRPAEGATVAVNPPSLTWVHENDAARYELQWSTNTDFRDPASVKDIPWSVYTHNRTLPAGRYYWRYRITGKDGRVSAWSKTRSFVVPAGATAFPKPSMSEMRERLAAGHPRLFVNAADAPNLKARVNLDALRRRAAEILKNGPTPEPAVRGTINNPETVQFWWPNRMQTLRACQEAEVLSFLYLATGEPVYREAARKWILRLAAWDPDGPTNWRLNDEAAMPILHRLARAYDWGFGALSEPERAQVRAALRRRGQDAWNAGQIGRGAGHLNQPYNSHGNRAWHKLGEVAIATFGEVEEAETWLDYAVSNFYAAYPVWADDDGGWHEGASYWTGYMNKIVWWLEAAEKALGIDGFRKPFFAHAADYLLYTGAPGSPNMGFGDLSFRPPGGSWSAVRYFARKMRNPAWEWWAQQWKIGWEFGEPVLDALWSGEPEVAAKAPDTLPGSKVFHGTGVAVLNSALTSAADNVQVRFKSSLFGRQSHGHDPHNSFTLNAYGAALLVNNVYRDLYGSQFHKGWVWGTQSQNALLVNGEGQKPHSADPLGRIVKEQFQPGVDYVAGEAAAAYEGKLNKYVRHVLFVKPDVVVIADEVEAVKPSTFQWMLHGLAAFQLDEARQQLRLEQPTAGVVVDYVAAEPLRFRQWDGYVPPPDFAYLSKAGNAPPPNQWHVEAAALPLRTSAFVAAVLRPYRKGQAPQDAVRATWRGSALELEIGASVKVLLRGEGHFAVVRKQGREWIVD